MGPSFALINCSGRCTVALLQAVRVSDIGRHVLTGFEHNAAERTPSAGAVSACDAARVVVVGGFDPAIADCGQYRPSFVESNGVAQRDRLLEGVYGAIAVLEIRKIWLAEDRGIAEASAADCDRASSERRVAIPKETIGGEKQIVLDRTRLKAAIKGGLIAVDGIETKGRRGRGRHVISSVTPDCICRNRRSAIAGVTRNGRGETPVLIDVMFDARRNRLIPILPTRYVSSARPILVDADGVL